MLKKLFFTVIFCTVFTSPAQANYLFTPSVTYFSQQLDDGTSPESDVKVTVLDFRLGYVFDFGLYVGGLYSIHDYDLLSDSSDSYFGPTVGYYWKGLLVAFSYYLYGERDLSNGAGKYSSVNGYQLDFSYTVFLTESFGIGPQLTYHSIKFSEIEVAGLASPADYNFSGITPYFNFTFKF